MKCPTCGAAVDFYSISCWNCGTPYLAALEKRAWNSLVASISPRPRRPSLSGRNAWAALLVLACLLAFGGWQSARPPGGLPLPPGAMINERAHLAFCLPEGWRMSPRPPDGRTVARMGDGLLTLQVSFAAQSRRAADPRRLAESEFDLPALNIESAEPLEVDHLPALRLRVTGDRVPLPSPNRGQTLSPLQQPAPPLERLPFRGLLIRIPGAGQDYLIKAYGDDAYMRSQEYRIQAFLDSIRVTARPLSAAHFRASPLGCLALLLTGLPRYQ